MNSTQITSSSASDSWVDTDETFVSFETIKSTVSTISELDSNDFQEEAPSMQFASLFKNIDWKKVNISFIHLIETYITRLIKSYQIVSYKISEVLSLYEIKDSKKVRIFLLAHPDLLLPLLQFPKIGIVYFPKSRLQLTVNFDPELHIQTLVLNIITLKSVEEASKKLEELDEKWWIDKYMKHGDKLCLNLQFQ